MQKDVSKPSLMPPKASKNLQILTPGVPHVEVLPQKSAAFITRVKAGEEVAAAAKAEGLSRRDLASQAFQGYLEDLLPYKPASNEQAKDLIRGFLWKTMLTSGDEKMALEAAGKLQKDPSLGFTDGTTNLEFNVLPPEIKALPDASPWGEVIDIRKES